MNTARRVHVVENVLKANDYLARQLRAAWDASGTFVVNLLGSPGGGKTTLLEAVLPRLTDRYRVVVLEGDVETQRDAERIRRSGVEAVQITTGGTCHLEAHMVEQAWNAAREGGPYDFVFIENIGNLVCPASFDLGEHLRVVLLSVPEGDDKPAKYPKAFRTSQAFVISKADLLPFFDFRVDRAGEEALALQPRLSTWVVSAQSGEGIKEWVSYLESERARALQPV